MARYVAAMRLSTHFCAKKRKVIFGTQIHLRALLRRNIAIF